MIRFSWTAAVTTVLVVFAAHDLQAFTFLDSFLKPEGFVKLMPSGSTTTYHGTVNSVLISFQEPSNAKCLATITTDDQRTIEVSTEPPSNLVNDIDKANPYHLYRDVLCDALQTASAQGWPVEVTTVETGPDGMPPNGLAIIRLMTESEPPTLSSASNRSPYLCNSGSCTPEGTVTSFVSDYKQHDVLCAGMLKVMPAGETPQVAAVQVGMWYRIVSYGDMGTMTPTLYKVFQAKRSMCDGLLNAMAYGQTIAVTGKIVNATTALTSTTITATYFERKSPPAQ